MKHKPIQEQVIVITGASSGIGLCTALVAAERGAQVVLLARSAQALDAIADTIRAEGGKAEALCVDVSARDEVDAAVASILERHGRIDTWVNNAGVSIYGRLDEVDERDSRRLFDINFWGVVHGTKAFLPHLKAAGAGHVVNISSVFGLGVAVNAKKLTFAGSARAEARARIASSKLGASDSSTSAATTTEATGPLLRAASVLATADAWPGDARSAESVVAQNLLHDLIRSSRVAGRDQASIRAAYLGVAFAVQERKRLDRLRHARILRSAEPPSANSDTIPGAVKRCKACRVNRSEPGTWKLCRSAAFSLNPQHQLRQKVRL